MTTLDSLANYRDRRGNEITFGGAAEPKAEVRFGRGSGNRVVIDPDADLRNLLVIFTGDDGLVEIGPTRSKRAGLRFHLRIGYGSTARIGADVGCAGAVFVSATEGEHVTIGDDVMFAKGVELRTDDTHAIYDVRSAERTNVAGSIVVGAHVWIAKHALVMGGVTIGDGSVVGFRSILTSSIPNNCVAVGAPARVVRRDIAWERPETPNRPPGVVWPLPHQKSEQYWNLTEDSPPDLAETHPAALTPARVVTTPASRPTSAGAARVPSPERSGRRGGSMRSNAQRVRSRLRRLLARLRARRR